MVLHYDDDDCGYEYEIDYRETMTALEKILNQKSKEELIELILRHFDIQTELEEYFYDDIHEYYEGDARRSYLDDLLYEQDPLGYYGMSWRDFI